MMMWNRRVGAGLLLGLCVFLSACGGGSNGSAAPDEPTALPAAVQITSGASVEAETSVQFTSDMADPPAGLSFHWDFGDGTSSDEASPSHRFNAPGEYEVALTLTNEAGESRSASQTVSVRRLAVVKGLQCRDGSSGWCWQNPLPTGNLIQDLQFVDAQTGWAVGEAGQILKTVDGGTTWTAQVSNVDAALTTVRFASPTVGWAVGLSGTVLRTEDGGQTWARQTGSGYNGYGESVGLEVIDEQQAIVMPYYYGARYTVDGGQTWMNASLQPDQVTGDGTLWSLDSGSLRKAAHLGSEESVASFDEVFQGRYVERFSMGDKSHGILVLEDFNAGKTQFLRTVDGGAGWQAVAASGLPRSITYLKQFGANVGWAVAEGRLYRSLDGGASWLPVALPSDVYQYEMYYVTAANARTVWFAHDGGNYVTVDGGATWAMFRVDAERDSFVSNELHSSPAGWWLSYGDRVYRSTDGGVSWTRTLGGSPEESEAQLTSVWFFDSHRGVATGTGGWLMQTEDGGQHWLRQTLTGQHDYTHSRLQFDSTALGWMSGSWGVGKSTDAGATWMVPVTDARMQSVSDFHFADARNGWAVAQNTHVFRSSDGGDSWTWLSSLPDVRAIRFLDEQVGFAAGAGGRVYRTVDGGVTWTERPAGHGYSYPERIFFSDAATGWIVGSDGSVLVSHDSGSTWSDLPVPARVSFHDVRFTDPLHGWIVGDEGVVMSTTDGGTSWSVDASGTTRWLYGVFFLDQYTGWIVGDHNSIIATATGGH
jgi:photosystem II stability/assembly factor-like uncharacterized protein